MTSRTVLISGASIAGPALAFWLHRHGFEVTVVERAPELRPGGQSVDLRGAGRTVAERMDMVDAVLAANTGEVGLAFVDARGVVQGEFPAGDGPVDGPTAALEILRGDLAALMYERTRGDVEYVFGDSILGLTDLEDRVRVTFAVGDEREFDLVVMADGKNSRTRSLVFAADTTFRSLSMYTSWFSIDRHREDDQWWRWFNAPGARTINLRPDNHGTMRAALSFRSTDPTLEDLDTEAQRALLRELFTGVGWESERVLDGMDAAPDFYFERIGQIKAGTWSRGRIAMVGDAAYCASPISGMGTSLALVGAYVLAGELSRHGDHRQAFAAYESILRPYVDQAQDLPPGTPRLALPSSRIGVSVLNRLVGLFAQPWVGRLGGRLFSAPADAIDLPDYGG